MSMLSWLNEIRACLDLHADTGGGARGECPAEDIRVDEEIEMVNLRGAV
jgi:hypothetical protein